MKMIKNSFSLICMLLCLFVTVHAISELPAKDLPDQDKSEIIESILEKEIPHLEVAPPFDIWDRYLSTENINFFQITPKLSNNFKLVKPTESQKILDSGENVQIWTFHNFTLKDKTVVVKVSMIERDFSCLRGYLTGGRELNYQYRKVDGRWLGEMTGDTANQYLH